MKDLGTEGQSATTAHCIHTIGHSNLKLPDFLQILSRHEIEVLVDVRSIPFSRHVPQYNKKVLEPFIKEAGLHYLFLGDVLGGKPSEQQWYGKDGTVQYDLLRTTPFFQAGLDRLQRGVSQGFRLALMCAEENPLVCHRHHLIAYSLEMERALEVWHIRATPGLLRAKNYFTMRHTQLAMFDQPLGK